MNAHTVLPTLFAAVALSAAAHAQIINGDFETGDLPPWVMTDTPSGRSLFSDVVSFDIDGAGPLSASLCARVMAGQRSPGTGAQGITLHQTIELQTGASYRAEFDWGVHALIGTPVSAGVFDLMFDGHPIATIAAPVLGSNQRAYGALSGTIPPAVPGPHTIGVRITRPITAGAEVWQHIDNFSLARICHADFNNDGDTGTDADIEAFFACLGGDCCLNCQSADFDNDGDTGTDADIEAFFRVLGGGSC